MLYKNLQKQLTRKCTVIKLKNLLFEDENQLPDASGVENELNRNNIETYYTQSPVGFQFTSKPLTDKANQVLISYWEQRLNAEEKKAEYEAEMRAGDRNWKDGIEWYNRYIYKMSAAENFLKTNGFIAK